MSDTTVRKHLCPHCGGVAVANLNVFPPRMWRTNTQTWPCEGCNTTLTRSFEASRWTEWFVYPLGSSKGSE